MSSQDREPNGDAADVNGGEERGGVLGEASGDATPTLEMEKGVFDQMAQFIEVRVVFTLNEAVSSGRDNRRHSLGFGLPEDRVGIVTAIGQQISGTYSPDKSASLRAISLGAFANKGSERQTMRIHGQMHLGVEPPFVRLMA